MALIAAMAVIRLGGRALDQLPAFPGALGWTGVLAVAGYVIGALGVVAVLDWASRRLGLGASLVLGLAVVATTRGAVALAIDAPLVSDWLAYHQDAMAVAREGPALGDRPIGYPLVLGALYAVFGAQTWLAEALNVAANLAAGVLLWDLLRRWLGARPAGIGLALFAMAPAPSLMTAVVSTEAVYAVLLLGAAWCVLAVGGVRGALAAGATLGAAQYVRPSSFVLVPAFLVAVALVARGRPRAVRAATALLLAFLAILAPVIADNWATHRQVSLATSSYGGWGLYVGANQAADGQWNVEDAARLAQMPGDTLRERSDHAGGLGVQRILDDPLGFAGLAARKFRSLWGEEGYATFYALDWEREPPTDGRLLAATYLASQLFWAGVTVGASAGVAIAWRRRPALLWLVILLVASVAALHTLVEVQPRYHAYLTPMLIAAAVAVPLRPKGAEAPPLAPG